jgi:Phytanoyl-CoA dioxygenase (PhyH)
MNNEKHQDIKQDGYILIQNVLTEEELNYGLSCIQDNKVDYSIIKHFIDDIFLPKIQETSSVITDPTYVKFRLSNNNNSTDASTFHGDIYNNTNSEHLPIYTCLCYFDSAQLEIIPGSHKYNNSGWSLESYNKKQTITVKRGDILIFHSNIHHRGINYNKTGNRRLLQVFDVFPDKETYNEHASKLIIVQSSESVLMKQVIGPILYELSKYPTVIDNITMLHYILMYNDLHYKMALMDIAPYDKIGKYVSYEPGRRRKFEDLMDKEDLNINIMCDNNVKSVSYSNYYLYFYIVYWILSFILLYIIAKIWYGGYKFKKLTRFLRGLP